MYQLKVLHRWWIHSWVLLIVMFLANAIVFGVASSEPTWIDGILNSDGRSKWDNPYIFFAGLAPFLNVYLWIVFNHFMAESIDDLRHYEEDHGTPSKRTWLLIGCAILWGALLLPVAAYPYSFHVEWLWGLERKFWFQRGQLAFGVLGAVTTAILSPLIKKKGFSKLGNSVLELPENSRLHQ